MFSSSVDDGATLFPNGGRLISNGGAGCFVAAGPSRLVYVFYYKGSGSGGIGGNNRLFVRTSTNAGNSFGPPVLVADLNTVSPVGDLNIGPFIPSFPIAAVNPVTARPYVYVVFNDDPLPLGGADRGDVFTSCRQIRVRRGPTRLESTARLPAISSSPTSPSSMVASTCSSPTTPSITSRGSITAVGRLGVLDATAVVIPNQSFQLSPSSQFVVFQDPFEIGYSGE